VVTSPLTGHFPGPADG